MSRSRTFICFFLQVLLLGAGASLAAVGGAVLYLNPGLPPVDTIRQIPLQTPLRVYTRSGKLVAEFGEKKRIPVTIDQIPRRMIDAILAAEDARFYEHAGVDLKSLSRAFIELATTGSIQSGGSTITMQLAKNYFLSSEKSFIRKGREVMLALTLEREFSKDVILELYFNKIYLGNRAYGIAAAAQVYYGKTLEQLSIAECAMLAGLPKAPSANNPVNNPARARARRDWILGRMLELGLISEAEHKEALEVPVDNRLHLPPPEVEAGYVAEMARQFAVDRFGETAYESGLRVYTTIGDEWQTAANRAVRKGILDYDRRHGYRGPEQQLPPEAADSAPLEQRLRRVLGTLPVRGGLIPAGVVEVSASSASLVLADGRPVLLDLAAVRWARPALPDGRFGKAPSKVTDVLKAGDIVRLEAQENGTYRFAQLPQVQAALVSLDANDGSVMALVGGFDFEGSKFNRAVQGGRQPGSSFKPFIYTAALAKGMTPATIMNDAPIVFEDPWTKQIWRPENHSGEYLGPIRLREALYKSKNLVSIRVLQEIGIPYALDYMKKFSLDPARLPPSLSLALGTAEQTPLAMANGYTVFANGGFRVEPWWVSRIDNEKGETLFLANPLAACLTGACDDDAVASDNADQSADGSTAPPATAITEAFAAQVLGPDGKPLDAAPPALEYRQAERVEEARIIWLANSMMKDVVVRGTARRALSLKRSDIGGKTGTTNDQKDAWFSGFSPDVVASAWIGFDNPATLGKDEFGGTAALPIWIDYMQVALKERPVRDIAPPPGLVTVKIDPLSGLLASPGDPDALFETFQEEKLPDALDQPAILPGSSEELAIPEQLF
jgi:penicillin-binding protein 1A